MSNNPSSNRQVSNALSPRTGARHCAPRAGRVHLRLSTIHTHTRSHTTAPQHLAVCSIRPWTKNTWRSQTTILSHTHDHTTLLHNTWPFAASALGQKTLGALAHSTVCTVVTLDCVYCRLRQPSGPLALLAHCPFCPFALLPLCLPPFNLCSGPLALLAHCPPFCVRPLGRRFWPTAPFAPVPLCLQYPPFNLCPFAPCPFLAPCPFAPSPFCPLCLPLCPFALLAPWSFWPTALLALPSVPLLGAFGPLATGPLPLCPCAPLPPLLRPRTTSPSYHSCSSP